jgi:hypothetical protein
MPFIIGNMFGIRTYYSTVLYPFWMFQVKSLRRNSMGKAGPIKLVLRQNLEYPAIARAHIGVSRPPPLSTGLSAPR